MKIDLNEKIETHFKRLEDLADEASQDDEESYSSRASAMAALSGMLKELTKSQAEVVNMNRIMLVEQALVEAAKELFNEDELGVFTQKLMELLGDESPA